jgi:hypothetical protein
MAMQILLIDGIKDVVLHNGVVRVECVSAGPNGQQNHSGTIVIPAAIAGAVVQTLANAFTELDKKLREQASVEPGNA